MKCFRISGLGVSNLTQSPEGVQGAFAEGVQPKIPPKSLKGKEIESLTSAIKGSILVPMAEYTSIQTATVGDSFPDSTDSNSNENVGTLTSKQTERFARFLKSRTARKNRAAIQLRELSSFVPMKTEGLKDERLLLFGQVTSRANLYYLDYRKVVELEELVIDKPSFVHLCLVRKGFSSMEIVEHLMSLEDKGIKYKGKATFETRIKGLMRRIKVAEKKLWSSDSSKKFMELKRL